MENFIFCAVLDGEIDLEWVNPIYLQFFLKYFLRKIPGIEATIPWAQDVNWTYIRCSEDVQNVFITSCVRYIYVLCAGVRNASNKRYGEFWSCNFY